MYPMAQEITGRLAPKDVPGGLLGGMSMALAGVEKFEPIPRSYRSETLRVIAVVTYIGDNSKARREPGLAHRPLRDGWAETLFHEMSQPGPKWNNFAVL
jgi:dihydroflavonol-4-reductase